MLSIIIPANNEEAFLGACLSSILASDSPACPVEIVVVANGCTDRTAEVARGFESRAQARGWRMEVLELCQGDKMRALNAGDAAAHWPWRAYLDADVTLSPALLGQLCKALDGPKARYASGRLRITAQGWVSRAYAATYRRVPFMARGVPGCGLFAVNAAGRARWGKFPDIISDDTYVRLLFRPDERINVAATYDWPIVEGFAALVRVRQRQDRGVRQVAALFPDLMANDDKAKLGVPGMLLLAARNPVGFAVYSAVALAVRWRDRGRAGAGAGAGLPDWSRGR
ncbi:glycosyltransferase family 2 protein [Seohaeicola saemankumensis]|uniref:Glycosyltransferase family 2 protein n=1 Tax=Seohaeicola saemankumensis TaxID=481181 RepID=A0ABW3TDS0_9RHOB